MNPEYLYDQGTLLDVPNSYAYASVDGQRFLDAWRRARDRALESLPMSVADPPASGAGPFENLWQRTIEDVATTTDVDRLVHRFEVTKRVYGRYDARWRPVDRQDFRHARPYIRFAELLDLVYGNKGILTYLNALLKCNDILVNISGSLEHQDAARVARLLLRERRYVEILTASERS